MIPDCTVSSEISEPQSFCVKHYRYNLTQRESQCLYYAIRWITAKAIGSKLGISSRTVEKYINNLKEKLGCNYKYSLRNKVMKDGMMNVIPDGVDAEYFNH